MRVSNLILLLVFTSFGCKTKVDKDPNPNISKNRSKFLQAPVLLSIESCSGLPMGTILSYNSLIHLAKNSEGFVRVRKTPIWNIEDMTNVIGKLKSGISLPAWGPLKNNPSQGIGYSVPLIDKQGKTCRGYISLTMIRKIECNYFKTKESFKGFPQPIDIKVGPCPK
jgi:hypothetical protein